MNTPFQSNDDGIQPENLQVQGLELSGFRQTARILPIFPDFQIFQNFQRDSFFDKKFYHIFKEKKKIRHVIVESFLKTKNQRSFPFFP